MGHSGIIQKGDFMGKNEIDILLELLSQLNEKMVKVADDVTEIKINCAKTTSCKADVGCRMATLEAALSELQDDRKTIKNMWGVVKQFWWLISGFVSALIFLMIFCAKHWDKIAAVISK
jgi:hypothetical protein